MTCSPMPVAIPCEGQYDEETCSTTCGQPETVKTKSYIVSVQPENGGASCPGDQEYTCPATDVCPVSQCIGDYEDVECPTDRSCDSPEMTIQRPFVVQKIADNCPLEGTSLPKTCPATARCYHGDLDRPPAVRATGKFKNQSIPARMLKYKNGRPYCLMIGGNDDTFSHGDSVELRDCGVHGNDVREKRLSSWRVKNDGRIETYFTTPKYKKNGIDQPLCLDYNNSSYKVTKCEPEATGNDLLNRTFTLQDHDKLTWSHHKDQVQNASDASKWQYLAPVRIVPRRTTKCMDDASKEKVDACDKEDTAYYMTTYGETSLPFWENQT